MFIEFIAISLSISYCRFETKGVKIIALFMPIILTVGFCRGFPFFSVERIINEEKIIAVKVATCAVAKRSWFKYMKFIYSFRKN